MNPITQPDHTSQQSIDCLDQLLGEPSIDKDEKILRSEVSGRQFQPKNQTNTDVFTHPACQHSVPFMWNYKRLRA
ncbi:hypothetical protein SynRS9909_02853 [Synechococcus sp. RS9909]|nr:hypothetical protein SynRS9909_02853 [Synechococcus sp. RS9909]